MAWKRLVLSALAVLTSISMCNTARADENADSTSATGGNSNRMNAVFKSLQENTQGEPISVPWKPLGILAVAAVGATVAIKQWNRQKTRPRPAANHRKLLNEAARAAGVSKRRLKQITPLAQAEGLSSPLAAMICPSAIKRLANNVRTADEQAALKSIAETLMRAQQRQRTDGSAS